MDVHKKLRSGLYKSREHPGGSNNDGNEELTEIAQDIFHR